VTAAVLAAAADTVAHAGLAGGRPVAWAEFIAGWHEFFLMAGTAAVTLAGLLFVAISIHVDALIHESREHLLSLARLILFSYVGVMVLSLMMLVPSLSMRMTATELIIIPLPLIAWTVRLRRTKHGTEHAEFSRGVMRQRSVMPLVGYGMIALIGVLILKFRIPEFFYYIIGAVCMLLGNAAGASWDLLVRTAKIRRREEGERPH
jgi:hypothetical protein